MAFSFSERSKQLSQLSEFIKHTKHTIIDVLNQFEWDEGHLQKEEKDMVSCPINSYHHVPQEKLHQHADSCSWRIEGYHDLDQPLQECWSTGFGSISIGKTLRTAILHKAATEDPTMKLGFIGVDTRPLPKTANRLVADFTSDERRAMYDYAVAKIGVVSESKNDLPMEFQKDDEKQEKPKTILEKLAEERDAKRRRVSYRNKKVHTNRKSQTEILREVIQNQMELYGDWLKQENNDSASEEHASSNRVADLVASGSAMVEHTESSFEERKIPYHYLAKLKRKRGNPYAIAREISNYMENVNPVQEDVKKHKTKTLNQDTKYDNEYGQQNSSTSSVKDENHHRRSRESEYERSYKSEIKVYDSHYSKRRKHSSSPESIRHRNLVVERYKSSRCYSNNTDYDNRSKYNEKGRAYSPNREHYMKYCRSEYKRDRRSSMETKASDYNRSFDEDHDKRNENSEYRKQGSNEYPEHSNHKKCAEATFSFREKDEHRKYREEKYNERMRHRVDSRSPEYHRKHKKHKHHRDKRRPKDSSESSQESGEYSSSDVSLSEESDADKKEKGSTKIYEKEVLHNKMKRRHTLEEGHYKHKHKKKHKKKKKKHIKRERKEDDFSG